MCFLPKYFLLRLVLLRFDYVFIELIALEQAVVVNLAAATESLANSLWTTKRFWQKTTNLKMILKRNDRKKNWKKHAAWIMGMYLTKAKGLLKV